jgi:hypothetical protein
VYIVGFSSNILPIIYDILHFWLQVFYSRVKNTKFPYKPLLAEGRLWDCYLIFGNFFILEFPFSAVVNFVFVDTGPNTYYVQKPVVFKGFFHLSCKKLITQNPNSSSVLRCRTCYNFIQTCFFPVIFHSGSCVVFGTDLLEASLVNPCFNRFV